MSVPPFQDFMLPLLEKTSDGGQHTHAEMIERLAEQLHLTGDDRKEMLPSGRKPRLDDRVSWAIVYLRKAGLLENNGRGVFCITERGRDVLRTKPRRIDIKFLSQFPEFQNFRKRSQIPTVAEVDEEPEQTPQEILEASYQNLRSELAQDLLQRVKAAPPRFFEQLVVDLLVSMGYGGSRRDAGQAIGQTGDGGIDGIIKEDKLGLDVVYVQAKRWETTVGRPVVQAFAGSLEGQRARKGVLLTTSQFSQDAKEYVSRIEKKIVLIDGEQLAQYMIDYGVGVAEVASYVVKKVDLDYFGES
jgi:restriction system protein